MRQQINACEPHCNNWQPTVEWQFTTRDACVKLGRLYPKP